MAPTTHAAGIKHANVKHGVLTPNSFVCTPGWYYDVTLQFPNTLAQVGPTQIVYNGTGSTITETLTSNVGGTVTLTVTGGGEVNIGAILAGVKASASVAVAASVTASIGNSTAISVPSHHYGNGQYGVFEVHTYGHYYFENSACKIQQDEGTVEAYTPFGVGWNTYIS
jgi:hypothetical protein